MTPDEKARVESVLKLSKQTDKDSIGINRLDIGNTYYVGIELKKAIENPGSDYDVVLREGDQLVVPQYTGTVKISGAVMYPNTVVYKKECEVELLYRTGRRIRFTGEETQGVYRVYERYGTEIQDFL